MNFIILIYIALVDGFRTIHETIYLFRQVQNILGCSQRYFAWGISFNSICIEIPFVLRGSGFHQQFVSLYFGCFLPLIQIETLWWRWNQPPLNRNKDKKSFLFTSYLFSLSTSLNWHQAYTIFNTWIWYTFSMRKEQSNLKYVKNQSGRWIHQPSIQIGSKYVPR